jgi:hypothetical protein
MLPLIKERRWWMSWVGKGGKARNEWVTKGWGRKDSRCPDLLAQACNRSHNLC